MLEAHELLTDLIAFFQPKLLAGRHVLLTAGPTSEPVDPIRVLSNRSSGKTGYALARARGRPASPWSRAPPRCPCRAASPRCP